MATKIASFGQFNPDGGEGFLAPIHYPSLMSMDIATPDGREMASTGMGTRTLPVPIMAQFQTDIGHFGAFVVGSLQEVTFWDDGNVEGWGWLVDTDEGSHMHTLLATKAMRQNSVDLADVTYEIKWKSDDPADGEDYWTIDKILFTQWKIGATTFVNIPAFPEARGELTAGFDPVGVDVPTELVAVVTPLDVELAEITAAAGVDADFDDFHVPEPDHVQAVHIDNDSGRVSFHLAEWGKPHRGHQGRNVFAPRPISYASFHQGGVDTNRGRVKTGPVFFLHGHPDAPLQSRHSTEIERAYGGIENTWCDVRTVNGRFGPWCSGRLRPGVTDNMIYMAKASGVSGHWLGDDLLAIGSVNVRGFETDEPDNVVCFPGSTLRADRDGGRITEDGRLELVASLRVSPQAERERVTSQVAAMMTNGVRLNTTSDFKLHSPNDGTYVTMWSEPAGTLTVETVTTETTATETVFEVFEDSEIPGVLDETDDELTNLELAALLSEDELPFEALLDQHS